MDDAIKAKCHSYVTEIRQFVEDNRLKKALASLGRLRKIATKTRKALKRSRKVQAVVRETAQDDVSEAESLCPPGESLVEVFRDRLKAPAVPQVTESAPSTMECGSTPPQAPARGSLEKFGFVVKKRAIDTAAGTGGTAEAVLPKKPRFAAFNQSNRLVPPALRFWSDQHCLNTIHPIRTFRTNVISHAAETHSPSFDPEAVLVGFFSTTYKPVEARPPFFGTHSTTVQNVEALARFQADDEMPQLHQFDYEYDSGDDWDSDGEGVDGDSDDEEREGDDESDDDSDFINNNSVEYDDQDDRDVHAAQLRREERRQRLRKKDKLVGVASGPFKDIALVTHPFRCDLPKEADVFDVLQDSYSCHTIAKLLEMECNPAAAAAALMSAQPAAVAATRASPTCRPEVCDLIGRVVRERPRASVPEIVTFVCIQFQKEKAATIRRTIKKHFVWGKLAGWLPREEPLADDHPLLAVTKKSSAKSLDGVKRDRTEKAEGHTENVEA